MYLAKHDGSLQGFALIAAGLGRRSADETRCAIFSPPPGELIACADPMIDANEARVIIVFVSHIADEVQGPARVRKRPEFKEPLRDDVGYRRPFGQRRHSRRAHNGSDLAKPFVSGEEESSILNERPAQGHS